MQRGSMWLVFALIVIGVVALGLVVLSLLPGLRWGGMRSYGMGGMMAGFCPWCGGTGFLSPWGLLAGLTMLLFMIAIPLGFVALLAIGVMWLVRSAGRFRVGKALSCPHCGREVQPGWKVCPHCGGKLEG